ncbi:prostatic acid phosphatase-like [Orussus abietinus]|uniref:prostatic acid phosphatase-like n=1 Tax=Orussus abietinus TaxID=222816 RepID=UPI000626814D|nr:prostatic acid phosphatase-like [Orussus abietinus]
MRPPIFFVCLSAILGSSVGENLDSKSVVFVNILFRHGDRTPVDPYPNDPYNNESLWPVPFGQLTNTGKHQQLLLGRWIRKRYSHLLSEEYSPYDVYIRSTDVDRTLMSAEANLAGLYPPKGDQVWDNMSWMPIPVHTIPEKQDFLLAGKKYCSRYNYELAKVLASEEMKKINEENRKLYAYLTEKSGKSVASLEEVEYIYNILYIESLYNKTLPEWTKSVFPDKLKPLAAESFKTPAYNKILQRLKSGPLLGEMIEHMVLKSKKTLSPHRKLWMYSAHDITVANMLMTLGLFQPHSPPYAASVMIELRVNSKNQYFVTVLYRNSTEDPILMTLPGCIAECPLSQFIRLTKDVIPTNWEKECSAEWEKYEYSVNTTAIVAILTSSVLMLILLVFLIVAFVYCHYKRDHNQYYLRLTTDPI